MDERQTRTIIRAATQLKPWEWSEDRLAQELSEAVEDEEAADEKLMEIVAATLQGCGVDTEDPETARMALYAAVRISTQVNIISARRVIGTEALRRREQGGE